MKECKECEYFNGYNYSDGTPVCEYDGGYEGCPYCDQAKTKKTGMYIQIDAGFMDDYIKHTIQNTVESVARDAVVSHVKAFITEEVKNEILSEVKKQAQEIVKIALDNFMAEGITVGGGWNGPERRLTRNEFLAESVENELKTKFKEDAIKNYALNEVKKAIDRYDSNLKSEINAKIKNYFDAATRQTLTENVVSMLMCNDTYKRLSESMKTFLP